MWVSNNRAGFGFPPIPPSSVLLLMTWDCYLGTRNSPSWADEPKDIIPKRISTRINIIIIIIIIDDVN